MSASLIMMLAGVSNSDPGYYGAAKPFSAVDGYINVGSSFAVATKIDLGASRSGTIASIDSYLFNVNDGTRECVLSVYTHDAANDRPDTCIATTGRFWDAATASTYATLSDAITSGGTLSSQSIVWVVAAFESSATRLAYDAATGRCIVVALDSLEWLNDFESGDSWTALANYASPTATYTDRIPQVGFNLT